MKIPGIVTLGDMSTSFRQQGQVGAIKSELQRLGYEVTTGKSANLSEKVRGDFAGLGSVESALQRLERYQNSLVETQSFVEAGQRALEAVQDRSLTSGANLITASSSVDSTVVGAIARDTRQGLDAVISALNGQTAGRSIFAGNRTGSAAIASSETIMADIMPNLTALTTAQDIVAAVNSWFDAPSGGFETIGYVGSNEPIAEFDLGLGQTAKFDFDAQDSEIRDVLKGFVLGSLLDDSGFTLSPNERQALVRFAGEQLLTAEKGLAQYRAELGVTEAAIDAASARNSAEISGLQLAKSSIISVDQYEAASALETAQVQLEMIYTVTVRMSRLNLMEFLR